MFRRRARDATRRFFLAWSLRVINRRSPIIPDYLASRRFNLAQARDRGMDGWMDGWMGGGGRG